MVSPNPSFVDGAFGDSYEEFLNILSMPDRYIIYREKYKNNEANAWRSLFSRLSNGTREEFLQVLENLNRSRNRKEDIVKYPQFWKLLEHYYPNAEGDPRV
jgi:hypothetical protein